MTLHTAAARLPRHAGAKDPSRACSEQHAAPHLCPAPPLPRPQTAPAPTPRAPPTLSLGRRAFAGAALALAAGWGGAGRAEAAGSNPPGCACPDTAPCPTDGPTNAWLWAPGQETPALTFWSPVTGTCLPWGPLGPVGLLAAAVCAFQSGQAGKDPKAAVAPPENLAALAVVCVAACAPRSLYGAVAGVGALAVGAAASAAAGGTEQDAED